MDHIEIEFKILLDKNTYDKIAADYASQVFDDYVQTNYYLFHEDFNSRRYTMRIRYKKGKYELTCKKPAQIGMHEYNLGIDEDIKNRIFNHEIVDNSIFTMLKNEGIDLSLLECGAYLTTHRKDIKLDHGILSLDENSYLDCQDYELEFEVDDYTEGKKVFDTLCQKYHLNYQGNCMSKTRRMKTAMKKREN